VVKLFRWVNWCRTECAPRLDVALIGRVLCCSSQCLCVLRLILCWNLLSRHEVNCETAVVISSIFPSKIVEKGTHCVGNMYVSHFLTRISILYIKLIITKMINYFLHINYNF